MCIRDSDIPKSMVRAEKPRIGGGFGAKQTAVCEVYPAFVTWKTKRPSKIIYSRKECQTIASPRHEMEAVSDTHLDVYKRQTLPCVFASTIPSSMPSLSHTGSAIYGDAPMTATYLSLIHISLATGFHNLSYFHKIFKRKFHMTPREFLKKLSSF